MKDSSISTRRAAQIWVLGACVAAAVGVGVTPLTSAQEGTAPAKKVRLSKLIHALEQGRPAIMGEDWTFFDAEHSVYDISDLARRITASVNDRDAEGRPKITPLVRPPGDGDSDTRWMVKQLLDNGAFGIVFPHIDTKEQALKAVQSMRYPPLRNQKVI